MPRNERDIPQTKFTLTNFAESYSMNQNSMTNDQLSDVLGTLIRDLAELGIINNQAAVS